ncbi:hypothetical protein ACFQ06_16535, partial [Tessaracoccus lubricantis]
MIEGAEARRGGLGARTLDGRFFGDDGRVAVDLGSDARLDVRLTGLRRWPHRLFGGSSYFQGVPALNQYWHPWLLGGRADGGAVVDGEAWGLTGAAVYGEKNWGRAGFPDEWWGDRHRPSRRRGRASPSPAARSTPARRTEVTGLVLPVPL